MKEIWSNDLREKAKKIKWFFTDVDGTLTDGRVYYGVDGEIMKSFSLRDGAGFFLLRQIGIKTGIITAESSMIVEQRARKLCVNKYISGAAKKIDILTNFLEQEGVSIQEVAYIGDELNDYKLIDACGLTFAVADADELIKSKADIICKNIGGNHAFREAVDILINLLQLDVHTIVDKSL